MQADALVVLGPRVPEGCLAVLHLFEKLHAEKTHAFRSYARSKRQKLRHVHYSQNNLPVVIKERHGDRRIAAIRNTLTKFEFKRSKMQRQFHEYFLRATAQHLYRDDHDVDFGEICERNHWPNMKQQVLCLTPRRFGKTTAVAMFVAAFAWCVPRAVQSIFSTGRRASYKLLQLVRELLVELCDEDRVSNIKGKEDLYVTGVEPGDLRKISSYPGNPKTLRGVGGDVLYLEEAAFLSEEVFGQVIIPLLEMDTTALIAISTPQDDLNFYSKMFEMKDKKGEYFFNTIKIGLICAKCQLSDNPTACTHMKDAIPPWKSAEKLEMVSALYGVKKDLMARESMGVVTQDQASVFRMAWIDNFLKRVVKTISPHPGFIFTACDPSGGGKSEMAIVSMTMVRGQVTLLAVDSYCQKSAKEIRALLVAHINGLRAVPAFANAWIVFIGEGNMGNEASWMKEIVSVYPKVWCMSERGRDGVLTTNDRKAQYASEGVRHFSSDSISMHANLLVSSPFSARVPYHMRRQSIVGKLTKQLCAFSKFVKARGHGKKRVEFSGKGPHFEDQDDLVMTLLIGLFFSSLFILRKTNAPYADMGL
jgi:hypothetical protein